MQNGKRRKIIAEKNCLALKPVCCYFIFDKKIQTIQTWQFFFSMILKKFRLKPSFSTDLHAGGTLK